MEEIKAPSFLDKKLNRIKKKFGKDKDLKKLAKGGSTAFIINLIGMGAGYLFIWLVSKIYGASSATVYGQYILLTLILRVGSIVTRFGMDTTMLRLTAAMASKNKWSNIFAIHKKLIRLILLFGVSVVVIVLLTSKIWANLLKSTQDLVITSAFFIIPMAIGLFYSQAIRGLKNVGIATFLRSSALPIFNFVLLLVLFPFFKQASFFSHLPSYTFLLSTVFIAIVGIVSWKKLTRRKAAAEYDIEEEKTPKQLLTMAYPLVLSESMVFIIGWAEQLMIGAFGQVKDAGIYSVCNRYTSVATLSLVAINQVSAANFSEYFYQKDFVRLKKYVKQTTKTITLTSVPILLVFMLFPKFFLGIFGSSFTEGWLALIFLSIGSILNLMTGSVGLLLNMTGHQKTVQNVLLVNIGIELALNAVLIPKFGVTGAAMANGFCDVFKSVACCYYVKKYFGFWSIYIPFIDDK